MSLSFFQTKTAHHTPYLKETKFIAKLYNFNHLPSLSLLGNDIIQFTLKTGVKLIYA